MADEPEESSNNTKRKRDEPLTPQDDWQLVSQGAEARLWKIPANSAPPRQLHQQHADDQPYLIIAKERFRKRYRHSVLDERLTKQRCRMEARILDKCRHGGIATPRVLRVEAPVLYMEYIDGTTVRNLLQAWIESSPEIHDNDDDDIMTDANVKEKVDRVGRIMGDMIGKVHGLGVIHGDLTTSNMMVRGTGGADNMVGDDNTVYLIDFGLAKNSGSDEDRAVDLYVLERALSSTHPSLPEAFMDDTILPAYSKVAPKADKVLQRLEQVRMRGRKRECFG